MGNTAYEVLTLDTPPEIMIPQESNGEAIVREPYSGHPIHEVPPFTTMRAYGGGTVTALPKDNLGNAGSLGESFPSTTDRIPIGTVSSLVGNVISFPSSNGLHGGTDVHWGGNLDSIYGVVPNRNGTTSNRLARTTESTTGTSN